MKAFCAGTTAEALEQSASCNVGCVVLTEQQYLLGISILESAIFRTLQTAVALRKRRAVDAAVLKCVI